MIDYLKSKYYWFKINRMLKEFLASNNESKILLFGYPKSGNTWVRSFLFSYIYSEGKAFNFEMLFQKIK